MTDKDTVEWLKKIKEYIGTYGRESESAHPFEYEQAINEILQRFEASDEDDTKEAILGWYELECYLFSNKQINKEDRMMMAYGALNSARLVGDITWEKQHELFGNFVADLYGIKVLK